MAYIGSYAHFSDQPLLHSC